MFVFVWSYTKGLAKLGNIVEEAKVSQFSCVGNNVAETNFAARKQENVFALGQKHFASRTQILLLQHMFPSLATPENITRNNVS